MNTATLAVGAGCAVTLQLAASSAYADKMWLESDSTIVIQSVTSAYPNKEFCLFQTSLRDGGVATFGFSLFQAIPLSPFSYSDNAVQWSHDELVQVQIDGNKPIINQAHIDSRHHDLSGLLIIPSSHLAEQMLHGHTLIVTTRAGARTFPIPADAVKAFQQCAKALTKER
jgi:hypothetical protein